MKVVLLAAALTFLVACGSGAGSSGAGLTSSTTIGSVRVQESTASSGQLGGFASLRAAAASVSSDCAETAGAGLPQVITPSGLNSGIALWQGPVVYAAAQYVIDRAGANVATGTFSSQGLRMSLPHDALPIGLWPCRTPVVFYLGTRGYLWMKPLTAKHGQRLGRILNRAAFDSHGRLVQVEGMTIHYLGGPTVTPRGLPTKGWRIERLAPSPRQQSLFLAEVEKPGCTGASGTTGRLYVISPRGNRQLATYDSCGNPPLAVWSQDGSKIFWTTYRSGPVVTRLHISDSAGRHTRILTSIKRNVPYALWSPDGRTIAYTSQGDLAQAADINSATRAAHALTHIRWKPTPPPRQPPRAEVVGWSPDGNTVLILRAQPNARRTTIEATAANGGPPHTLIQLKPS
jgi:hypothetical protein